MSATPAPNNRRHEPLLAAIALFLAAFPYGAHAAEVVDPISVTLDQATVMKMPDKVSTVVIGNPLIADVAVQTGGVMVVTGKGYGVTNVVALDRAGNVLMDRPVEVKGPRDGLMVVYRGIERESYNCAPKCEQRVMLGDTTKYFDLTLGQAANRNTRAQAASQPTR